MKKNILKLMSIVLCSVFLCSCAHYYYPTPTYNPMLSEAKNFIFTGGMYTSAEAEGKNMSIAYSPIQNLGILYTYNENRVQTMVPSYPGYFRSVDQNNTKYRELCVGYYHNLDEHGLVEFYGGYGLGRTDNHYGVNTTGGGESSLSHNKIVIMPSIGAKFKHFQISYGIKFYRLKYDEFNMNTLTNTEIIERLNYFRRSPCYLMDNALTVKLGIKNVQLFGQSALTSKLFGNNLQYAKTSFNFGLQIELYKRKKSNS